jgi:ribose transport system permease protein
LIAPNFLTPFNLINIVQQTAIVAIAAVGMTVVILVAGIDLSVGSAVALSGTLAAMYLTGQSDPSVFHVLVAVLIATGTGALIGGINGVTVALLGVPAFIATLAALTGWRGVALLLTDSNPVSIPIGNFTWLGTGYIGPIPVPVMIMILTFVVGYLVLSRMKIGRRIYAIGGNEEAARLSGVRVTQVLIFVYAFAGVCAGVAGAVAAARLSSGQPAGFVGFELDVIAAVVVGGTSLMGGRGRLSGTLLGALLIGVLGNGLTLMDVQAYWQQIVTGLVIVAAIVLDNVVRRTGAVAASRAG